MKNKTHNLLVQYCKKCLMPTSRPRVQFDENGVCNACNFVEVKNKINWFERENQLKEILNEIRSNDGSYDCIVPWSGGKDSSYVAYQLKFKYKMNPLLVTFAPLLPNEIGQKNKRKFIELGFDNITGQPNLKISKHLSKRFFIERGNPKTHWDAGVGCYPVQIAEKFNIRAIFYAEHAESEYGGRVISEEHTKMLKYEEVIEHVIEDHPSNWVDEVVTENDLQPYLYPDPEKISEKKIISYYYSFFERFDMYKNYLFIKENMEFNTVKNRTVGTFTNFDSLDDYMDDLYYYMQYIKFGFGRCVRDTSRFIQNGHLTRNKALNLAKKYDGEFPQKILPMILEYYDFDRKEFENIVDQHRNKEIWEYKEKNWSLIQKLY